MMPKTKNGFTLPFRSWAVIENGTKIVIDMKTNRREARDVAKGWNSINYPGRYKVKRVRVTEDYHGG